MKVFTIIEPRKLIRPVWKTKGIADICKDVAQVSFASIFIQSLLAENVHPILVFAGILGAIFFWVLNLLLIEK